MIAHLGTVELRSINAATSLSLQVGFDYASHDKPLGKPTQQRLGGKLDTWRLSFSLRYQFCEPQESLDALKQMVEDGQPVPLVFNNSDYQGNVTVNDLDINYKDSAPDGTPLVIEGTLSLTEYVGAIDAPIKRPAVRKQAQNQTPIQATSKGSFQDTGTRPDNRNNPFNQRMQALSDQFRDLKASANTTIDKARALQQQTRKLIIRR